MNAPHRWPSRRAHRPETPAPRRGGCHRPARARQRGASTIGVLTVLGVAILLGLFAIRLGPAYLEHMTVSKIVADKSTDATLMRAPPTKIYQSLNQAYRTNNLWDLKAEDTVLLERDKRGGGFVMRVKYEKRSNLFANIDVVTVFDAGSTTL